MFEKSIYRIFLFIFLVVFGIGCKKDSPSPSRASNSNGTMAVYSTFVWQNVQYGASETINVSDITSWYLDKADNSQQRDYVSLCFTDPIDNEVYSGFDLESPTGVPLHIGSNPNCTMSMMGGDWVFTADNVTVNLTKVATSVNDYYEGTFSGIITRVTITPFSEVDSYGSGSFKVPLKDI